MWHCCIWNRWAANAARSAQGLFLLHPMPHIQLIRSPFLATCLLLSCRFSERCCHPRSVAVELLATGILGLVKLVVDWLRQNLGILSSHLHGRCGTDAVCDPQCELQQALAATSSAQPANENEGEDDESEVLPSGLQPSQRGLLPSQRERPAAW